MAKKKMPRKIANLGQLAKYLDELRGDVGKEEARLVKWKLTYARKMLDRIRGAK